MNTKPVILIVDDTEIDRALLTDLLKDEYYLLEAANGEQALEVLKRDRVTLVLTDLIMPVMNGYELLAAIKKTPRLASIPVIVMTARNDNDIEAKVMESGAADFITKPFNGKVLQCRIKNVISRQDNEWLRSKQRASEKQLLEMHRVLELDALTNIYNREAFYRKAGDMLQQNKNEQYSIIYLNVAGFKMINAIFRSEMGDIILRTAAYYFKAIVGKAGIISRLESDHFVLLVPSNLIDIDDFLMGLDATMASLGLSYRIRFYAGIYPIDDMNMPVERMCDMAKIALDRVEGSYTKRYARYDSRAKERMLIEQMLARDMAFGLQAHQFGIYIQPIYNLRTGMIIGGEALARWKHPKYGMIKTDQFSKLFERNGFIVHIDRYICEEACKLLKQQLDYSGIVFAVSVNISRLSLQTIDLNNYLVDLIARYGLEPCMLKLEITEDAYEDDPEQLKQVLGALKDSGFEIIMDNFGLGASSISMIRDLPLDILKVDIAFMQGADDESRAGIIMQSLVDMAHNLSMRVIVEGAETDEQIAFVDRIGCSSVQGYYYSHPMSPENFIKILREEQEEF